MNCIYLKEPLTSFVPSVSFQSPADGTISSTAGWERRPSGCMPTLAYLSPSLASPIPAYSLMEHLTLCDDITCAYFSPCGCNEERDLNCRWCFM